MADNRIYGWRRGGPGSKTRPGAAARRVIALSIGLRRIRAEFWLTLAMLVAGAALHYLDPLPLFDVGNPLHRTRHSIDRVLFMIPVLYAGFIFGPRGGFLTLVLATSLMLPPILLYAPNNFDSFLELASFVLVCGLVIVWFKGQQDERKRRLEVLGSLEIARQELASQVERIVKDERRLAAINEVCSVVSESLGLPYVLQRILDKAVGVVGVSAALIFLKDADTRKLELVAHKGVSREFVEAVATLRLGEGFNGAVAESGEPMVVENAPKDPRLSVPQVRAERLQSQLIVPLKSKGVTTGTLCVASRGSRRFTADEVELLTAIGKQVGIAIENARLYQEAIASEQKYRDLFDNATVAIFVHDLKGNITAANKACAKLMGFPLADLIGVPMRELLRPHSLELLAKVQNHLLQGEKMVEPYDVQLLRRGGEESILVMTTRLVKQNDRPQGFHHIAIDVTQQRRMRETINEYLRQILTAQEEERRRIARELHDETAQSLLLILQKADILSCHSDDLVSQAIKKDLEDLRAVVLHTLSDLRRLTQDLRPQILDDLGLIPALEWLADDMERQCRIKSFVEVRGVRQQLTSETQLLLFRIAQEALSNVRRHSNASEVKILLELTAEKVRVIIEDDGQGFEAPDRLSELARTGKLGILGMSERARLAGGWIDIQSTPDKGTRVVAELSA